MKTTKLPTALLISTKLSLKLALKFLLILPNVLNSTQKDLTNFADQSSSCLITAFSANSEWTRLLLEQTKKKILLSPHHVTSQSTHWDWTKPANRKLCTQIGTGPSTYQKSPKRVTMNKTNKYYFNFLLKTCASKNI